MAPKKFILITTGFLMLTYIYLLIQIKPEGEPNSGHNLVIIPYPALPACSQHINRVYGFLNLITLIWCSIFLSKTNACCTYVEGWGWNTTRDANQYINNNLTAYLMPDHFCDYESFIIVMVCSKPSNLDARNAIRETWGQERHILGNNVSLFFLIGETVNITLQYDILSENERYGDIIQERFIDTYNNLTLKSLVMLKLFSNHCTNSSKYLFKVDDDVFVNMPLVIETLLNRNSSENVLLGRLICRSRPIRDVNNKWYVPQYMYPDRMYPNYLSGTAYLMSSDVVPKLYKTALKTPILHLEDVFITGICSKLAGIKPRNNPMFTYQRFTPDPCLLSKIHTVHYFTPDKIRKTYQSLRDGNVTKECTTQRSTFSVNRWMFHNIIKIEQKNLRNKCE